MIARLRGVRCIGRCLVHALPCGEKSLCIGVVRCYHFFVFLTVPCPTASKLRLSLMPQCLFQFRARVLGETRFILGPRSLGRRNSAWNLLPTRRTVWEMSYDRINSKHPTGRSRFYFNRYPRRSSLCGRWIWRHVTVQRRRMYARWWSNANCCPRRWNGWREWRTLLQRA